MLLDAAVADSSSWVRFTAYGLLYVHIAAGGVGLIAGGVAVVAAKGARLHRIGGNIFFGAMLVMAALGAVGAAFISQRVAAVAGVLAFYLVATGWRAVREKPRTVSALDGAATLLAAMTAAAGFVWGITALKAGGMVDSLPAEPLLAMSAVAGLGAVLDLRMLVAGGIEGAARIARHLWRMCGALSIAAMSFFPRLESALPAMLQDTPVLMLPTLAVLGVMVYWLVRLRRRLAHPAF